MTMQRNTPWNVVLAGRMSEDEALNHTSGGSTLRDDDPLYLQGSDHPGSVLVSTPLTGNNYLSWSISMLIALGAKTKLGFINGKIQVPAEDSFVYEQWKKVDCMVTSWILNLISKDIVEAFLYANSAKELWDNTA